MFTDNLYEAFHFSEFWDTLSPTFISFYFIFFVFALVLLYYVLPQKIRWTVLLCGSILFYSIAGIHPLITILLTALITYLAAMLIESTDKKERRIRRFFLSAAALSLLAVLVFVKCYSLFEWKFNYVVPLGISYYTFSAIGYLADIYWGKDTAERNFFKLALFLLFFPKILQGPIARHRNLGRQLVVGHAFDYREFCFGIQLAVWGYFKKMVIADRISIFTDTVFSNCNSFGGAIVVFSTVLSAVQLYCDFSGCIDIAAGVSQMFGIQLEKNFDHPFFSHTVSEFWRRWHITLGTWFRDYVYMPFVVSPRLIRLSGKVRKRFGKRPGKAVMTIIPLAVVWILTGLWHGTGSNYIVWGAYWGILIILSTVFAPEIKKAATFFHIDTDSYFWKCIQVARTFLLFCVGRLITIPGDLAVTGQLFKSIFTDPQLWQLFDDTLYAQGLEWKEFILMLMMTGVLWFVSLQQRKGSLREKIAGWNLFVRCFFYASAVIFILIFGIYGPSYDTSSFVYMNY